MAGTPGSGKSTWIENHKSYFSSSMEVISRDKIRFSLLKENEPYFSKENEVWKEYVNQAITSIENNADTILDATHLNASSRGKILRTLRNHLNEVEVNVIVISVPLETAIERNNRREGLSFVPLSALKRMYSQMTLPTLEEGFDHIYIYSEENGKAKYQVIEKKEVD